MLKMRDKIIGDLKVDGEMVRGFKCLSMRFDQYTKSIEDINNTIHQEKK